MGFGALVAALALVRYRTVERGIARGEFRSAHGMMALVTIGVVVVAVSLIVYLATS